MASTVTYTFKVDASRFVQTVAEIGEAAHRLASQFELALAQGNGRRAEVVTGHDGVSRVRVYD
jgi:hypothetical protein